MWWRKKAISQSRDDIVKRDQELTAHRKNYFAVGQTCFDREQINRLRAMADKNPARAEVSSGGEVGVTEEQRRTVGCSVPRNETNEWVYGIITGICNAANKDMRYDIIPSMNDPIQILRYDSSERGFFRWHCDTFPDDMTRKMSVVVVLSDPSEYEGGQLEFDQGGAVREIVQTPGVPVVFPSWLHHQVTPVTAGTRYSLAAWMRGPNWR